jgi:hypothetical protein
VRCPIRSTWRAFLFRRFPNIPTLSAGTHNRGLGKNEIDVQQQRYNRPLTWQEKGKIAHDMAIDKVYTSSHWYSPNVTQGLKPAALVTPDEMRNATVWAGGQQVRMMDIPTKYALQATQANIAAWRLW